MNENKKTYKILSVKIVEGKTLNIRWNSKMQIIETDKGTFIDNLPEKQFGRFRDSNPGYNWEKLIGKEIDKIEIKYSKGHKWINYQP